ncbi:MAG: hypothetical protein ACRC8K_17905 [Waterburya sp.]
MKFIKPNHKLLQIGDQETGTFEVVSRGYVTVTERSEMDDSTADMQSPDALIKEMAEFCTHEDAEYSVGDVEDLLHDPSKLPSSIVEVMNGDEKLIELLSSDNVKSLREKSNLFTLARLKTFLAARVSDVELSEYIKSLSTEEFKSGTTQIKEEFGDLSVCGLGMKPLLDHAMLFMTCESMGLPYSADALSNGEGGKISFF